MARYITPEQEKSKEFKDYIITKMRDGWDLCQKGTQFWLQKRSAIEPLPGQRNSSIKNVRDSSDSLVLVEPGRWRMRFTKGLNDG